MDQEIKDARARLASRFGEHIQIGGKGRSPTPNRRCRNLKKKEEACCLIEC